MNIIEKIETTKSFKNLPKKIQKKYHRNKKKIIEQLETGEAKVLFIFAYYRCKIEFKNKFKLEVIEIDFDEDDFVKLIDMELSKYRGIGE